MRRVIVTGARDWTDRNAVRDALAEELRLLGPFVLVHGDCPTGADAIASEWSAERGVRCEAHPADWSRHGRRAGPIRNAEMVRLGADVCLAFPFGWSRGTWNCVSLAREAGIPTKITRVAS